MTSHPTAGETVTPDQLALVETVQQGRANRATESFLPSAEREHHQKVADALSALLREREALRAALVEYAAAKAEWIVAETDATANRLGKAEHALDALAALLTGTTARTEEK